MATVAWSPSAARTVTPSTYQISNVSTSLYTPLPLQFPAKASADLLDFTLGLSAWLADSGDALSTESLSITPTGNETDVGVVWSTIAGQGVTMALSGGTAGTIYTVAISIVSLAGRRETFVVLLPISTATASQAPLPPIDPPVVGTGPNGEICFCFANLPTQDPGILGAAYTNGDVVMISGGSSSASSVLMANGSLS